MVYFLELLYFPLEWLLAWTFYLPAAAAVAAVGVLSGLAVNLIQKYLSDQELLDRARADLRRLKELRREARASGDGEKRLRLSRLSRRIGGRYFWGALKPAFLTIPVIGIVALWTGARLGFRALRLGDEVAVVAHFDDGAAGFAHIVPNEGIAAAGPAIARVEYPRRKGSAEEGDDASTAPRGLPVRADARTQTGRQASFRIRAANEGMFPLVVRHGGRSYEVELPVRASGGRPPDRVTFFDGRAPSEGALLAVELLLEPAVPGVWWTLYLGWAGVYVLAAVASGVGFRYALRVR
jgi:hypothetical protein